mgnify:CR=1 FL=1|tara:strand:+ start:1066 stop:1497 length:432 start_codon:yes stop_codon:yes gene_type:complete
MASELKVNTLTGVSTAGSIAVTGEGNSTTTNLQQGLIKQWVNLTAATPAYKDSFNASTITDEGLGIYEYPFTNPMGNANYSAVGCASTKGSNNSYSAIVTTGDSANSYGLHSTASIRFNTYAYNSSALTDQDTVNSMVSGDLA